MTTPASNNRFKGVTFQDQATPATPAAGDGRLFLDTADGLLKWIDDAGTVTEVALGSGAGFADPMTTRGDIIVRNASNVTARLAKGAAGTYLGSDGTDVGYAAVTDAQLSTSDITTNNASTTKHGFAPKYPNDATKYLDGTGAYTVPAGSSPGLVLLEQHTASTSATLDFTTFISSTYDCYMFSLVNVVPSNDSVVLWMRMGTGAGPSWDTGNNYVYADWRWVTTPANGGAGATAQAQILVTNGTDSIDQTATLGACGHLYLYNPQSTTVHKAVRGDTTYINTSAVFEASEVTGRYVSTTAVTGVRFLMSAGNIASGTIRVYGLAK